MFSVLLTLDEKEYSVTWDDGVLIGDDIVLIEVGAVASQNPLVGLPGMDFRSGYYTNGIAMWCLLEYVADGTLTLVAGAPPALPSVPAGAKT